MPNFMNDIKVVDVVSFIIGVATFFKAIDYLFKETYKKVDETIKDSTKSMDTKIGQLGENLDKLDRSMCKNYLIQCFYQNRELSEYEKQRAHEVYQHYRDLGGNSYIKEEFERMQDEGKL